MRLLIEAGGITILEIRILEVDDEEGDDSDTTVMDALSGDLTHGGSGLGFIAAVPSLPDDE